MQAIFPVAIAWTKGNYRHTKLLYKSHGTLERFQKVLESQVHPKIQRSLEVKRKEFSKSMSGYDNPDPFGPEGK